MQSFEPTSFSLIKLVYELLLLCIALSDFEPSTLVCNFVVSNNNMRDIWIWGESELFLLILNYIPLLPNVVACVLHLEPLLGMV
jgi:hypothetical protein